MPLLIDIRKLSIINQLIDDGATNVANSLETLADVEANVEVKSIAFLEPQDISKEIGTDELYGVIVELTEPPYGAFLTTFSIQTAKDIARLLTGSEVDGEFNQFQESALSEMANVLTSGFIDGIANTLETTIDIDSPALRRADGVAIGDEALSHVRRDSMSIVLDSLVDIADTDIELQLHIFLIPDPGSFVHLVDNLDVDTETQEPVRSETTEVTELDMSATTDLDFDGVAESE
jgi:chemotaxis protein CheC